MNINFIQSFMKSGETNNNIPSASLRQGQIVNGEILKLFKNNLALLQIGTIKMLAELDASLQDQSKYLFQVMTIGPPVKLKVLERAKEAKVDQHVSTNSPILQYLHQIPVQIDGVFKDLTIQWSGGKTSQQKLDPNFCRIIFYLDLEVLHETLVDIHIQNRIINITVINNTAGINELIEKLQLSLKNQLAQLNYTLSSIKVQQATTQIEDEKNKLINQNRYHGVDIRI